VPHFPNPVTRLCLPQQCQRLAYRLLACCISGSHVLPTYMCSRPYECSARMLTQRTAARLWLSICRRAHAPANKHPRRHPQLTCQYCGGHPRCRHVSWCVCHAAVRPHVGVACSAQHADSACAWSHTPKLDHTHLLVDLSLNGAPSLSPGGVYIMCVPQGLYKNVSQQLACQARGSGHADTVMGTGLMSRSQKPV
jgi:hypothetical protein